MQLKSRHLVILHHLSVSPQTVYSMAHGDVGVITDATEMGIHHACKSLEKEGFIKSTKKDSGAKKVLVKSVTSKGKELLQELKEQRVTKMPVCLSDLYVLDNIKNDPKVHEGLVSVLFAAKAKARSQCAKDWIADAIKRYSKAV